MLFLISPYIAACDEINEGVFDHLIVARSMVIAGEISVAQMVEAGGHAIPRCYFQLLYYKLRK